jgi:cytochrome c oxidase subunit IV
MSDQTQAHPEHRVPSKVYLLVGAALLVLTAITVAISYIPLGGYNLVIALAIATLKAALVAMFFMHLLYDNRMYFIIVITALSTLTIFIVLTLFDTLNRGLLDSQVARPIQEQAIIYRSDSTRTDTTRKQPQDTTQTGNQQTTDSTRTDTTQIKPQTIPQP